MSDSTKANWVFTAIATVLAFALFIGGWFSGHGKATSTGQIRIDSLTTELSHCQTTVAKVKYQGDVAEGFLDSYDNEIVRLENEKRILKNAYSDTIAVLRKYNSTEAERAIAAYYYQRRAQSGQQQSAGLDVP